MIGIAKQCLRTALRAAVVMPLLLAGCVGYQLGSMLPEDIETIHVPTFVNTTKEPLLEVETTRAVIAELQKDGSLKVSGKAGADSILSVTLTHFDLSPVSFSREINTLANEYRITITVRIMLVRTDTNEVIVEIPRLSGESEFQFSGDLTTAKRQSLPTAAADLAHDIVEQVVEYW